MSKRVFEPKPGQSPMTKNERRDAARVAKAHLAAKERQRKITTNVLAAVAVIAVLVGGYFWINSSGTSTDSGVTPAPSSQAWVPDLPAGADERLKTKPVVATPTGKVATLKVTNLIEGKGPVITAGSKIIVNYVGVSFKDGTEFDSSWKRSETFPLEIPGQVIAGWNEGLLGAKEGSRIQLDIPAAKAYGETGQVAGDLRFVIDILSVTPGVTPTAKPTPSVTPSKK